MRGTTKSHTVSTSTKNMWLKRYLEPDALVAERPERVPEPDALVAKRPERVPIAE